jgi:glutamate 5-kinase
VNKIKRMVVKVGGGLFLNDESNKYLANLVAQIAILIKEHGIQVIVVSSGAINNAIKKLGREPKGMAEKQAFASIGQKILIGSWDTLFAEYDIEVGQVLLIYDDLDSLMRRKRALNTMKKLIELNAVPVINENDTTAVDEIKWGDNDPLSVMVAELIESDLLVLLTDVDGLYGRGCQLIPEVEKITSQIENLAYNRDMESKIDSAKKAILLGIPTIIASWKKPNILLQILKNEQVGTKFLPAKQKS